MVSRPHQQLSWSTIDNIAVPASQHESQAVRRRESTGFVRLVIFTIAFLLVALVGADVGRMVYGYVVMTKAVREGATVAARSPASTAEINGAVLRHGSTHSTLAITCTSGQCSEATSGDEVTVKAIWNFEPITFKLVDNIWDLEPFVMSTHVTMKVH